MLTVLSPAKRLDFESDFVSELDREPALMQETIILAKKAKTLKAADLKSMMNISDDLAALNVARFQDFTSAFTLANAKAALDAFKGDVYVGLDSETLSESDRKFADQSLRILSGLYGVLRPLDLMQPYRLEMGTRFKTDRGETLYEFWGDKIALALKADIGNDNTLINLASNEYFKAVDKKALGKNARIITPQFKEIRAGEAKVISFFAKKARGMMARYIVKNRLTHWEDLKDFSCDGYRFNPGLTRGMMLVFTRD